MAVIGLGKMGISHLSMVRALPGVEVVGIVDTTTYVLGVLKKYTGLETYTSIDKLLAAQQPDAAIVATPSRLHYPMVKQLLEAGVAVFCEKPFTLSGTEGEELVALAQARGLVTQVGYHNRFVGAFGEVKRLLDAGAIGTVTHGLAESYGPVVLKPQGGTWRSKSSEGGGCLYDYAAHPLNLINWYLGEPVGVGGTVLNSVFSAEIDDEVSSTLYYGQGRTVSVSVNWSDESVRKMTTRITLWGTGGRIFADRQEIQVYLREDTTIPEGYNPGWNVRYTTELTQPVEFYLRGEEYTAQLAHFVERVRTGSLGGENTFASALVTDKLIERMVEDSRRGPSVRLSDAVEAPAPAPRRSLPARAVDAVRSGIGRARTLFSGRK
ncbi:MAG: Gfo/Idh/MocA family oxidoreductase [Propionicimonas sp.]|uniref:Gfo/Idh/MocA family protein n=1 Tax=Propionicimonas sp. TaxID=1955623 RepID=UPI002B210816|nr:Gfo/Idh/MocA family oxidoreductase [Propionicimonas sp.]MEA4945867.1 Gfo/Idh/MocA family oxidoreductase [Propionicimonas sp.]MEA5053981.1 Gfo/Idh/MocA family oxidoreductase [Propionicimonas sp.]MEA5116806.1 Gfo/Idh/MocA family oxidoreductase [Propionicimonas sp.]